MATKPSPPVPEWVQPGNTVLIVQYGDWRGVVVRRGVVERLTAQQVIVTTPRRGSHDVVRCRRDTLRESAYGAELIDPASEQGRRLFAEQRERDLADRIRYSYNRWNKAPDRDAVQALIRAATEWRDHTTTEKDA